MHNADIPLSEVRKGIFLLLGDDPLLDEGIALHQFCEPVAVVGLRCGRDVGERSFLLDGGIVVRAAGYDRPTGREIGVEVVGRNGGRILVLFPDHRHMVCGVNIPDPPVARARNVAPHSTGSSARGLVDYRLPGFWRDASVVVSGLPVSWFGGSDRVDLGLDTLDMAETLGGVVAPEPADVAASETPFHGDLTIGKAVLCWAAACGLEDLNPWAIDGSLVAPASSLVGIIWIAGSAALRLAGLRQRHAGQRGHRHRRTCRVRAGTGRVRHPSLRPGAMRC